VPVVSRFFGIVIAMYYDDHQPPHFHARYGGKEIQVGIADGRVRGKFPPRALGLVLEWWSLHQSELATNWQLVSEGTEPNRIQPLE
jgi:phosphomannomutase